MRTKSKKNLCCNPKSCTFNPTCCEGAGFVLITKEEIEALNLKNIEKLEQSAAAERMGTSQSTFQRILSSAYAKTSDALVNGKIIRIEEDSNS